MHPNTLETPDVQSIPRTELPYAVTFYRRLPPPHHRRTYATRKGIVRIVSLQSETRPRILFKDRFSYSHPRTHPQYKLNHLPACDSTLLQTSPELAATLASAVSNMASILIVGGLFVNNKIQEKRAARKEKKLQRYEDRYNELKREHTENEEKYVQQRRKTESDVGLREQKSRDSMRSESSDGPAKWVDEAGRARRKEE